MSEAAWEHMEANPDAPRASVLSILDWKDAHLADRPFPFTPSVSDVYALHACLGQYLAEGPAAVQRRHSGRRAGRSGPAPRRSAWSCGRRTGRSARTRSPRSRCRPRWTSASSARGPGPISGVMLSGGQGELAGRVIQIGHMGPSAYPLSPVIALTALGRALRGFGVKADVGAAVEAALAALDGPVGSTSW